MDKLLGSINQSEYEMDSDLTRRIRNFNLSPDQYLIPLFEAISNSIHAIQERFQSTWTDEGKITVEFIRTNGYLDKIQITDNGIGLNDYNFDSFLKTDSEYKKGKGGKGIGRFSWLLSFDSVTITSSFRSADKVWLRKFNFSARQKPVHNHTCVEYSGNVGSVIELSSPKSGFAEKYNATNIGIIAKNAISHFLLTMFVGVPDILFIDGEDELNIKEIWNRSLIESKSETLDELLGIKITHLMLRSGIIDKNTLCISANYRSVDSKDIGKLLGLKNALKFQRTPDSEMELGHYVGVLEGDLFDRASYSERTGLNIGKDLLGQIIANTVNFLKTGYLKPYYDEAIKIKTNTLKDIIAENPKFSYLIDDIDDFVEDINLSSTSKIDIYRDLSTKDYTESQKIAQEMQAVKDKANGGECMEIQELAAKATKMNQSALAEYIKHRKDILELLETRRGWADPETKKNYLENDIHSVVCPMRVESDNIKMLDNNLWILDDRLAYYKYLASDKQIKSLLQDSSSELRPDIAIFGGCNAFVRERTNQPVVIIEFKRPERDDYKDSENPIRQVLNYIDEFRNGTVRKPTGQVITTINSQTPFQCYIVCDITPKLLEFMKLYGRFEAYPDGHGYRSYREEYKAMIDIISYENLIADAKLRNEIFFDKLGILE